MACRLFGTKPLSKPMLAYCQLDPWEHISVNFKSKHSDFHWRKLVSKYPLQNGGHFVSAWMCLKTISWIQGFDYSIAVEVVSTTSFSFQCKDGDVWTESIHDSVFIIRAVVIHRDQVPKICGSKLGLFGAKAIIWTNVGLLPWEQISVKHESQ